MTPELCSSNEVARLVHDELTNSIVLYTMHNTRLELCNQNILIVLPALYTSRTDHRDV